MNDAPPSRPADTSVLRTLSPALRGLERGLRAWLDGPHRYPLSMMAGAALEGLSIDLRRQADALDVDRPLLVVALMGGTGVGKSTLLNALAGGSIAHASFQRPTTRDPVVYYHESVKPDRLDPALRGCRLVPHDRPALQQKILIDTPDLDSTDLTNRDKTLRLLPVADVVVYVGSQEKYHDQLIWDEFLKQRKRRGFVFVLNKWDRCLHAGAAGLRPDEDWLRDLQAEGFEKPLLFRTSAQLWVDRAQGTATAEPPDGEQFHDLIEWLEMGLSRLEIEAIKARGVGQLLTSLQQSLANAAPPDLTEPAVRVRAAWSKPLSEEAAATADVLVNALEPYRREIEHHFYIEGHRRFRGFMAGYFNLLSRAWYAGSTLRSRIPFFGGGGSSANQAQTPAAWNLAQFTAAVSNVAGNRELDARSKALVNRLLVEAEAAGYPLSLLAEQMDGLGKLDWRKRYSMGLTEVLDEVEKQWTKPTGARRFIQTGLVIAADWLPPLALLSGLFLLLWNIFLPFGGKPITDSLLMLCMLPLILLLTVLVILHILIILLLPLRWEDIRTVFHRKLQERVEEELATVYAAVPSDLAEKLLEERKRIDKLIADTREVASWLEQREQSASITGLYGH